MDLAFFKDNVGGVNLVKLLIKFNLFSWFYSKARIWKHPFWNKTYKNNGIGLDIDISEQFSSCSKTWRLNVQSLKGVEKLRICFKNFGKNLFASLLSTNNHWALGKNVKRIENVGYQDSWGRYHDWGKRILWSFVVNRFCLLESIGKSVWKWPLLCSNWAGLNLIWMEQGLNTSLMVQWPI